MGKSFNQKSHFGFDDDDYNDPNEQGLSKKELKALRRKNRDKFENRVVKTAFRNYDIGTDTFYDRE